MTKSICVLSSRFELNDQVTMKDLKNVLNSLSSDEEPLKLIDKQRYYKHIWEDEGIMHLSKEDIFQISPKKLEFANLIIESSIFCVKVTKNKK